MRIGIPRALMFYRYYPFLKIFLEGCGHEVVSSPPTDLRILEGGVESCVDDVCVAVKVFYGHVRYLEGVADALLVPRPVSVEKGPHDTFTCPKLIAAPDMARFYRKRPPVLLEWVLDARKVPWWWGCLRLAARLRVPPGKARKAYRAACRAQRRFESLLSRGWLPDEAVEIWEDLVYERREAKVPPVRRMGRGIDAGEPSMRIRPGGEDGGPIPLISRFPAAGRPPVDEGMGRTRLRLEKAMCLPRFSEKLAHVPLPRGKRKDMAHISYNGVDYHLTSVRDRTVGGNSGRTVVG
ncbi:MAG: acyl-CoA dehydratase activase-related protein, partial [Actinomycetota bacterium]|nr:acyl-CoA dehydratase activase-related protein [Actinomycetota bacterium]